MKAHAYLVTVVIVQLITLMAFASIVSAGIDDWRRYVPFGFGALAILWAIVKNATSPNGASYAFFASVSAAFAVIEVEMLARTLYPGLSKDIELGSSANVARLILLFGTLGLAYFFLSTMAASLVKRRAN